MQKASTTTRQFCPENLSGEKKLADLCVSVPALGLIGWKAVLSPSFLRFLTRLAAVRIANADNVNVSLLGALGMLNDWILTLTCWRPNGVESIQGEDETRYS